MAREDFAGQTGGGGITDFTLEVTDAWFGLSEAFEEAVPGANQIFLHWVGKTDLEDWPVLTEEGFHPSWKVGPDWEIRDDGKRIEYVGDRRPKFGKAMGRLCDQVLKITEDIAETPEDPLGGDNRPQDASTWIGQKWYMETIHFDWGAGLTSNDELHPTNYLGKVDVSGSAAPAAAASASSNGDLREQVENLARNLPDYATFQAAALQIPGVAADGALVAEIADESKLYARVNS